MSEQATQKRPNKGLVILISVIGVLLVGVIVLLLVLLLRKPGEALPVAQPGAGNTVVDEGFDPDAMRKAAAEMFEIKMSNLWEFPDGASPASDAYVANSKANSFPFYFEVVLPGPEGEDDQDEVLYTSPILQVGSSIRDITLNRDLDAGLYECNMLYYVLNPDNTVYSTLSVVVRLNVAS